MCAYRKAMLTISMQLHAMSLRTIWSISFPLGNKQMPVRYWFFLLATQYNSSFMNKITLSSPAFRGKTLMKVKLCKVYTLECQEVDEICFRYNKICLLVWYFRKAEDGCASTFPMACNKKTCNHRKKHGVKKIWKYAMSLQVRNWGLPGCVNTQLTQKII